MSHKPKRISSAYHAQLFKQFCSQSIQGLISFEAVATKAFFFHFLLWLNSFSSFSEISEKHATAEVTFTTSFGEASFNA